MQEEDGTDSRADDFDSEEDGSVGLSSKLQDLQQKIDDLQPSLAQKYNEYKVAQGMQDRLEDAELPDDIGDDRVFEDWKWLHQDQLKGHKGLGTTCC